MSLPLNHRIIEGLMVTVSPGHAAPHADAEQAQRREASGIPPLDRVNVAPMGPIVDEAFTRLIFRPFRTSTTYRNLKATGEGVFHVTDDVLTIARGATRKLRAQELELRPADRVHGLVLTSACRYHEVRVTELDDRDERTHIVAEIVHTGRLRDFFGFNRAKHAVIEAAILASRVHLTGAKPVLDQFEQLQIAIDKTGSGPEHQAMNELRQFIESFANDAPREAAE